MMKLRPQDVFTPGAFPEHTYVYRGERENERTLKRALKLPGILCSILGPSKSGKTSLANKVLGDDYSVPISGSEIQSPDDVWRLALAALGVGSDRTVTSSSGESSEDSAAIGIKAGPVNVSSGGKSSAKRTRSETTSHKATMAGAVKACKGRTLLLDDFHYVKPEYQKKIAQQLKEAISRGLKVVILAVPHRGDDSVRANPDLRGRVSAIDLGFWGVADLKLIGLKGFSLLGLPIPESDLQALSNESLGSPQLMQSLCLHSAFYMEENGKLGQAGIRIAANDALSITDASSACQILEAGPRQRGGERKQHVMLDGARGDNYVVILRALSLSPPKTSLSYTEILNRAKRLVTQSPLEANQIKRSLRQMNSKVLENLSHDRVLEWDEIKEVLTLDPYFLFYLRWKRWPIRVD